MESIQYTLEFNESPVGIKFGHQLNGASLVVFNVNPQRIAYRLGVENGDEVLEINGRKVKDSEASLEFFRSLTRGKQFPIRIKFLRERLINVRAAVDAHLEKQQLNKNKKIEQEASFNAPPLLHAEVSYGGLWFPATVQKVADGYYHATFVYSDLAVEHDLVGQNSTIPADRVQLSAVSSIQETLNDIGEKSVAAFESLQTGLTEDPMGYLGSLGKTSVNAGVSWASNRLGSLFGSTESDPDPEPIPKQPTEPPKQNTPPDQSIYFNDEDEQGAYPIFRHVTKILEEDSEVTDFSASRIESSETMDDQQLLQHFLAESAKLKAQLLAECAKEVGDL